jgi:hypothetical protein
MNSRENRCCYVCRPLLLSINALGNTPEVRHKAFARRDKPESLLAQGYGRYDFNKVNCICKS